jgi:enamine deaminase RidA (YjgF/YER057c/UK114 family)
LRQALKNTVDILAAAGARPDHIARMVWYVLDKQEYMARAAEAGAVWRAIIAATTRRSPSSKLAPSSPSAPA